MNSIFRVLSKSVFILGFLSSPCWAYYEVLDNAEILSRGAYKLTGATQALTESGGLNATGIFDAGFTEDFGARALAGFGKTDFYFGAMAKWIPIPDVENQPAVGFNGGLIYAKWLDGHDLTFRVEPLVSKKFNIDSSTVTPYASLPIGIRMRNSKYKDDTTEMTWQLVLGSQLQLERWKNLQFIGEVGLDLDNSLAHVEVGAIFYFDDKNGFEIK